MDAPEWDNVFRANFDIQEGGDMALDIPLLQYGTPCVEVPQLPTPPPSESGSPTDGTGNDATFTVSTAFHPESDLSTNPPDLILFSADGVSFYVHSRHIIALSTNSFNLLLPLSTHHVSTNHGATLPLPESADVLNIVLRTVYRMSCSQYLPSIDAVIASVHALCKYGMPLKMLLAPSQPLFFLVLALAPLAPIQFYALAGAYDLDALAAPISSHLIAYQLSSVTEELAAAMGPVYLKRLFFLHLGRIDALRQLLLTPLYPHPRLVNCGFVEQKKLTRAWALATAYIAWEIRPDLSTRTVESALYPLGDAMSCPDCKASLRSRVKDIIVQWTLVKESVQRTKPNTNEVIHAPRADNRLALSRESYDLAI
ncbi:hypothetical protein CERSUDRAFT_106319 [Gelatoporia subvermispora B]|uniref:BTB domain-containing protein n=1 Tax=Ceriporiopsis subvermispora (strain B) TaxID=914234 RepID=M2PJQ9_CERS8|nr:hypothetical protein CERSUDRAFT_106319 [Gelatoporia subvermispora B]